MGSREGYGGSFSDKLKRTGLPLLAAAGIFSDGSNVVRAEDSTHIVTDTVGNSISGQSKQEKVGSPLPEVGRDFLEVDFLNSIKELLPDVKNKLFEQYRLVIEAARDSIFESRMKNNENNRQEYFERVSLENQGGKNIREIMSKAALEYGVPVDIALALAGVESNFLQSAEVGKEKVKKGEINWRAVGMFMIQEKAAIANGLKVEKTKRGIVDERRDLETNIFTGMKILGRHYKKFDNNWFLAFESYHDGYAGVVRHLNILFPELTLNERNDDFDKNGRKAYEEMQKHGDLNSASLFLTAPDYFRYANEVQGMLRLVDEFLGDESEYLNQKIEPKQ